MAVLAALKAGAILGACVLLMQWTPAAIAGEPAAAGQEQARMDRPRLLVLTDIGGGALSYRWWVYAEAGTYVGAVSPAEPDRAETSVTVPPDAAGKTIHIILEVTDGGNPPLTAYRRCVLNVGR